MHPDAVSQISAMPFPCILSASSPFGLKMLLVTLSKSSGKVVATSFEVVRSHISILLSLLVVNVRFLSILKMS